MNELVTFAAALHGIRLNEVIVMLQNKGFVGVKRASEILDVAPNTVRAWGASGKITEYRHPANNYRLYEKDELLGIKLTRVRPEPQQPSCSEEEVGLGN